MVETLAITEHLLITASGEGLRREYRGLGYGRTIKHTLVAVIGKCVGGQIPLRDGLQGSATIEHLIEAIRFQNGSSPKQLAFQFGECDTVAEHLITDIVTTDRYIGRGKTWC